MWFWLPLQRDFCSRDATDPRRPFSNRIIIATFVNATLTMCAVQPRRIQRSEISNMSLNRVHRLKPTATSPGSMPGFLEKLSQAIAKPRACLDHLDKQITQERQSQKRRIRSTKAVSGG